MMIRSKRSLLDERELKETLRQAYGLPDDLSVTFWRTGIAGNDVYVLSTRQRQYMLKIYFIKSTLEQVRTAATLMAALFQQGIPVPRIYQNKAGDLLTPLQCPEGTRYGVVFERIQGQEPDISDACDGAAIGRLVGRMYRALDEFDGELAFRAIDQAYLIQSALNKIQRYLPEERDKIEYLADVGRRLWALFEGSAANDKPQYGICHGDLHTGNMLKTSDGEIYLFDFDACGTGWRIYDLGIYANDDWTKTDPLALDRDREALQKFLRGYQETISLTAAEMRIFPFMLGLRHFELFGLVLRNCVFLEGAHWIPGNLQFHYDWFSAWEKQVDWQV